MAKRSLKASAAGIQRAKQIFDRREWTQEYLASAVGLQTRQSIWKFFTGRPIERYLFIDICFQLDLDWEEIVDRPPTEVVKDDQYGIVEPTEAAIDLSTHWDEIQPQIVQQLIAQHQSTRYLLDIYQSIDFAAIYTELAVVPYQAGKQWWEIDELQRDLDYPEQADFREIPFQRQQSIKQNDQTVAIATSNEPVFDLARILQQQKRVILLGQAGAGKSCLLQAMALQACNSFQADARQSVAAQLPIYIALHDLEAALKSVGDYENLARWLQASLSDNPNKLPSELQQQALWLWLLQSGKVMLLFDGLDEISLESRQQFNSIITQISQEYSTTSIVVTSRLGVLKPFYPGFYPLVVEGLQNQQITQFAQKWFATLAPLTSGIAPADTIALASRLVEALFQPQNRRLLELARNPLILHSLCLAFCDRQQLPQKRSRLYEHIIEVFLVQWDEIRGIRLRHTDIDRQDLRSVFAVIAFSGFAVGEMFFEKSWLLGTLTDYIQPLTANDSEHIDRTVAKIMDNLLLRHDLFVEVAKGIYTFSHPTLQEYLCAKYIIHQGVNQPTKIADHILDSRWYEVILLTLENDPQPINRLRDLQAQLETVIAPHPDLADFLQWIDQIAIAKAQKLANAAPIEAPKIAALRAFYFGSILNLGLDLAYGIDSCLAWQLPAELSQDLDIIRILNNLNTLISLPITVSTTSQAIQIALTLQSVSEQSSHADSQYQIQLAQLWQIIDQWDQSPSSQITLKPWAEDLRSAIAHDYSIIPYWAWSNQFAALLERYYWANIFLIDCCQKNVRHQPSWQDKFLNQILKLSRNGATNGKTLATVS